MSINGMCEGNKQYTYTENNRRTLERSLDVVISEDMTDKSTQ